MAGSIARIRQDAGARGTGRGMVTSEAGERTCDMYRVRIGESRDISVALGETILDAATRQGVALAHSCQAGNCGSCKCRLVAGEVEMAPYSPFALSTQERAKGLILACRAVPWSDCTIVPLAAEELVLHPVRLLTTAVVAAEPVAPEVCALRLEILEGGPFLFSPGQYARVTLPGAPPRDFSMASQPGADELVFYIRLLPGGRAAEAIRTGLRSGDQVVVEGPYGTAYLREHDRRPLIAVAGGTGIAPLKAIVERVLALDWPEPVHLYFGARRQRDLFVEEELAALAARHPRFHFVPVLSEERAAGYRHGLVTEALAADLTALTGHVAHIAGPPPMVEAARERLLARGVAPADIHADPFTPAGDEEDDRFLPSAGALP